MSAIPNFAALFQGNGPGGSGSTLGPVSTFNFGGGSGNQYMSYPTMPSPTSNPVQLNPFLYGGVGGAPQGPTGSSGFLPQTGVTTAAGWNQPIGGANRIPGGMRTGPTIDPALTGNLASYLQSQIGQGLPMFDQSVMLPSTGMMTAPGTLTAPENPLMQQLQQFFMGQGSGVNGVPGTGGPLSYVLPMWQSEIGAMNIPIQEQMANLQEAFGSRGSLGSSEMANAMQDYLAQTATGEQSLLGQLTMQALPQEMQMATGIQNLDQSAIQNALQQYTQNLPQNNPLLQEQYGMATTMPQIYKPSGGVLSSLLGSLPGLLGGVGSLISSNPWGIFGS